MCYFLYLASPLTLSEIRSMLPPGITADLLPPAEQQALRDLHPPARSAVRLLVGGCSCDLMVDRDQGSRESERHLRNRFFGARAEPGPGHRRARSPPPRRRPGGRRAGQMAGGAGGFRG